MRSSCYLKTSLFIVILLVLLYPGTADENGKSLIAIYMVGSDLESLESCATTDIKEMLTGIPEDPDGFDLVIGYGGSRKMGWRGLTIATLHDIRADFENGVIGDEKIFRFHDNQINMGSSEGLSRFLDYVKDLDSYTRYILFFWDHGGGYQGICFDENYDMDAVDLTELKSSIEVAGIHWDLIGMDACLMGSYEVAKAVEGTADYLMVSEEAEPGHGWNYTIPLNILSNQADISIPDWGRVWINEYIDNPYHDPNKKTLALIDLRQVSALDTVLSDLGQQLNMTITDYTTYNGVGASIYGSQRYGYDPSRDQEQTIDLYDLSLHLDQAVTHDPSSLSPIRQAISDAVIYERNDGTRPGSHGISIFSPRMKDPADFEYVITSVPVNKEWERFITNYMTFVSLDDNKPVISELGDGKYQVTDDKGLAYVRIDTDWMPDIINLSHSYGLKSEPVSEYGPGIYIPIPDDQTFYLKDTESGESVPFFHLFIGRDNQGQENYFGYVQIMRGGRIKEAVINPIKNTTTQEITYTLFPYETRENGEMIFSKVPATLKKGDLIIPKLVERFLVPDNPRWQYTPYKPLAVTGDIIVVRDRLPYGSFFSTLTAADYNLNFAMAIVGDLRFPNNSSAVQSLYPD